MNQTTLAPSDEELMAAYVAGDQAAFAELFRRYAPVLLRLMQHRLARRQEADDLVQQTFLQLHRSRYDFRTGAALRPWLLLSLSISAPSTFANADGGAKRHSTWKASRRSTRRRTLLANLALLFHCPVTTPLHLAVIHAPIGLVLFGGYQGFRAARSRIAREHAA